MTEKRPLHVRVLGWLLALGFVMLPVSIGMAALGIQEWREAAQTAVAVAALLAWFFADIAYRNWRYTQENDSLEAVQQFHRFTSLALATAGIATGLSLYAYPQ